MFFTAEEASDGQAAKPTADKSCRQLTSSPIYATLAKDMPIFSTIPLTVSNFPPLALPWQK